MYIYKTTCLINGKIYIGQSSKISETTKFYYGSGVSFCLAIKKYNKKNFLKEILKDDIQTQQLLDTWEMIFIKKFNSCDDKIGYNIMPGTTNGFGNSYSSPMLIESVRKKMFGKNHPMFGKHHSIETKKKMSDSNSLKGEKYPMFGKKISEKHKAALNRTGISPWNKGISLSLDHKQHIRQSKIGKARPDETKQKMRISMIGNQNSRKYAA